MLCSIISFLKVHKHGRKRREGEEGEIDRQNKHLGRYISKFSEFSERNQHIFILFIQHNYNLFLTMQKIN